MISAIISIFDEIDGLGKKRQTLLWRHFKTLDNLYDAKPEDFAMLSGISENLAFKIYNAIHKNNKDMQ